MAFKLRLTVATRLFLGFAAVSVGVLIITLVSLAAMQQIQTRIETIVNKISPAEKTLADLQIESLNLSRYVSLFFNERDLDELAHIRNQFETSKSAFVDSNQTLIKQIAPFEGMQSTTNSLNDLSDNVVEILDSIESSMNAHQQNLNALQEIDQLRSALIDLNVQLAPALKTFVSQTDDTNAKEFAYEAKSLVERGGSLALQMTFASNLADFQTTQELFRKFSDSYGALGFKMLRFARNDDTFKANMQVVAELTSKLVETVTIDGGVGPIQNEYLQLRSSLTQRLGSIQQNLTDNVNSLNVIAADINNLSKSASDEATEARESARLTLIIALVVVFLLSVIIGFLVVQSIRRPLNRLRAFIRKVGQGDLTSTIGQYSQDELGDISRAMDQLVSELHLVVTDITEQSALVSQVAQQTSRLSDATAEKSGQQQQDVDMSVHSIGEMSESIKEVARTAEHTSQEMQAGESEAQSINQGMVETVNAIMDLNEKMQKAVDVIHVLDQGVVSIESILETIQTIAEQTNLLALNAAIEAARAGEQGRGFAVVADEVRTLATRTQASTEEIREKIEAIQKQSTEAVQTISSSQQSTANTTEVARNSGDRFNSFMNQIRNLSTANVSIAAAAEEQSATTDEMGRLMKTIGELTGETTAITQQVADGIQSLNTVAQDLDKAVHRFKTQ